MEYFTGRWVVFILVMSHTGLIKGQNENATEAAAEITTIDTSSATSTPTPATTTTPSTTTPSTTTPTPATTTTTATTAATTTTTTTSTPATAPTTTTAATTPPATITTTTPIPTMPISTTTATTTTTTTKAPVTTTAEAPKRGGLNSTILYVIVAVIIVLVIALVVVIIVFCQRRKKANKSNEEIGIVEMAFDKENGGVVNTGFDQSPRVSGVKSRPIPVDQLLEHVRSLAETPSGFRDEFVSMVTGPRYPYEATSLDINKDKNRFLNIVAYDHTRVVLHPDDTGTDYVNIKEMKPGADYINANYMDGYKKEKEFIAAQGPLNQTVEAFWRMVWQNDCSKIVMVTNLVEKGRSKCAYYWPHEGSETFGALKIRLEKEETFPEYIVRILELSKGKERKTVLQFHFVAWPDEGAPTTGTSLLTLQELINSAPSSGSSGPVLVHCSAGIGRSGTFIAVDYLKKQAAEEGVVDILGCIDGMREQRINIIQSLEQYIYIYTTMLEALYCGHVRWPASEFPAQYSLLVDSSFEGEETPATKQLKVIDALTPSSYASRIKAAHDPANRPKNRSQTILPAENVRPYLQPIGGAGSNYINAVLVDSFIKRDTLMVTQMPLPNTVVDFWRLVVDFRCNCIIMVNQMQDTQDCKPYWPHTEEPLTIEPYLIKMVSTNDVNDRVVTDLIVKPVSKASSTKSKDEKRVRHIQLTSWPEDKHLPESTKSLIDLYEEAREVHTDENLTLMHCLYGAEKSGLVCAALVLLEAIETNSYVDVFNVVKSIRRSRPQFIATEEQYKFLHTLARDFVESRSPTNSSH